MARLMICNRGENRGIGANSNTSLKKFLELAHQFRKETRKRMQCGLDTCVYLKIREQPFWPHESLGGLLHQFALFKIFAAFSPELP